MFIYNILKLLFLYLWWNITCNTKVDEIISFYDFFPKNSADSSN